MAYAAVHVGSYNMIFMSKNWVENNGIIISNIQITLQSPFVYE